VALAHLAPRMKQAIPPLQDRQRPGLSQTLHFFPNPEECQSCGCAGELTRWRECDEWDKPTAVVVVLCAKCSKKLIDPHPRLYHQLQEHEPFAGSMQICLDCPMREGVSCTSPLAKSNGGPGMEITAHGFGGFFCGSKSINGYHFLYQRAPSACAGREAAFQPQLVV
jgi:hypothetical protein